MDALCNDDIEFLACFKNGFDHLKGERILIYGTGKHTKIILDHLSEFNIVGLMDRANLRTSAWGHEVYTVSQATELADVIIMVAPRYAQHQIYGRISHLRDVGIRIYDPSGREWTEDLSFETDIELEAMSLDDLKKEIDMVEIVSFDVFDTLLMRKSGFPNLIFFEVEKAAEELRLGFSYSEIRGVCQTELEVSRNGVYTLDEIYLAIGKKTGCSDSVLQKLKGLELDIEKSNILPRMDIIDAFNYSVSSGKKTILVTDMYLPSTVIEEMLKHYGVDGYDTLFVSCENGATKRSGTIWDKILSENNHKSILHIGDDIASDTIPKVAADTHNVASKSYSIKKAVEMRENSALRELGHTATTKEDLILLGLIDQRLFGNAFSLYQRKGVPHVTDSYDLGYIMFGPITLGFVLWLAKNAEADGIKDLLFFSRDGYIIKKAYDKITQIYFEHKSRSHTHYFYTSRRVSALSSINNVDDISAILSTFDFIGSTKQYLAHMFDITANTSDEFLNRSINSWALDDLERYLQDNYLDLIFNNAKDIKKSYRKYLNSLGIDGSSARAVDLKSSGSNVYYLNSITGWNLKAYCYVLRNIFDMRFEPKSHVIPYLHDKSYSIMGRYYITSACDFAECVYTSPDGMLLKMDDSGNPVFEDITNTTRDYMLINRMHEGILGFIDDFFCLYRSKDYPQITPELADSVFGLLSDRKISVSKDFGRIFTHYEYFRNETRYLL